MNYIDLTNQKFGKLKVISFSRKDINSQYYWNCICECGNAKEIASRHLRSDRTKSCGCISKFKEGVAAKNLLYRDYIRSSIKRIIKFSLSLNTFIYLTSQNCHYCNRKPNQSTQARTQRKLNGDYLYNGLDRKDNTKGYTNLNSIPCCKICNRAKSDMSYKDFMTWIKDVKNA